MPKIGDFAQGREIGSRQKTTKFIWHACEGCGKERWVRYVVKKAKPFRVKCLSCSKKGISNKHFISPEEHERRAASKRGSLNPMYHFQGKRSRWWKGGTTISDGYICVRIPHNDFFRPMVTRGGYIKEHRLIMARHLNRCLLPWEVVHHKNGIRDDNRLENLELITDKRFHMVDANTKSYIKQLERRIQNLEFHKIKEVDSQPQWSKK